MLLGCLVSAVTAIRNIFDYRLPCEVMNLDDYSVYVSVCGIVGGGIGNLIDRFFRPEGVVDFIDVKFYGLFGMERWPTFNVADSAVVVCGILLIISFKIIG